MLNIETRRKTEGGSKCGGEGVRIGVAEEEESGQEAKGRAGVVK